MTAVERSPHGHALVLCVLLLMASCSHVNPYYDPNKPHHRPDGFQNVDPAVVLPPSLSDFLRWQRERFSLEIAAPKMDLSPVAPDLALIPIGAYEPRWFMGPQHVDPAEAVQIHRDLRAKLSIGVHWGTFQLTDEPLDQAVGDLAAARTRAGVADDAFIVLRHGTSRRLD